MSKYPFVTQIDGRHIPGVPVSHAKAMTEACARVRKRTGYRAVYNARRGSVIFMATDHMEVGGAAEEFVYERERFLPINVDQTCRRLARAKRSYEAKKAQVAKIEREHKDARDRYARLVAEDVAPEVRSVLRYQMRKLEDGRHSRPMILIP